MRKGENMNPIKKLLLGRNYTPTFSGEERRRSTRPEPRAAGTPQPGACNPPDRIPSEEGLDRGNERTVINLENAVMRNEGFRTALWTGENMQLTVMSIPIGGEIGAEQHEEEQLLKITSGLGEIYFTSPEGELVPYGKVTDEFAIIIPRGAKHNLKNIGNKPLKLYSVYAPAAHPYGTVEIEKKD